MIFQDKRPDKTRHLEIKHQQHSHQRFRHNDFSQNGDVEMEELIEQDMGKGFSNANKQQSLLLISFKNNLPS